jgi:integrase/recombinase XerD
MKSKPTDLSFYLTKYLSVYLPGTRGSSGNTVASRRDAFALLLGFCRDVKGMLVEKIQIKTLTTAMLTEFLDWLEKVRGCSASTRNQRLTSIKGFFKYLQTESPEHISLCQQIMFMPLKKTNTGMIGYLTLDGIKGILDSVDSTSNSGRRDLVLLSVLYDSGARVQELADLTVGDIRLQLPGTIKLTGKGNKTRIVPILEPTAKLLKQYLVEKQLDGTVHKQYPLFCNRSNQKLTRAGIAYILKKYVDRVRKLNPTLISDVISVHSFRHSKAMHMLQAGVPLIYIRDFLGHVEISTTEIYARCDGKMKREAFEGAYSEKHSVQLPVWQQDDNLMIWLKTLC